MLKNCSSEKENNVCPTSKVEQLSNKVSSTERKHEESLFNNKRITEAPQRLLNRIPALEVFKFGKTLLRQEGGQDYFFCKSLPPF